MLEPGPDTRKEMGQLTVLRTAVNLHDADRMVSGKVERQIHCCWHDVLLGFPSQHETGELPVSTEQALAELEHLDAESQRVRNQQAKIDERIRRLRTYVAVDQEFAEARSKQETDEPASTAASTSDTSNGKTLSRRTTDMAVDLIRAKGQPIHTRDLLAQMEQHGLTVGGQDHVATLSSYLSRAKEHLVNNRRLGWRLVEWGGDTPPNGPPKEADATSGR